MDEQDRLGCWASLLYAWESGVVLGGDGKNLVLPLVVCLGENMMMVPMTLAVRCCAG